LEDLKRKNLTGLGDDGCSVTVSTIKKIIRKTVKCNPAWRAENKKFNMEMGMTKNQRIALFSILIVLLPIFFKLSKKSLMLSNDIDAVLFSALMMLAFTVLFLEHFFTKPTDVLASTISILLLITPLKNEMNKLGIWYQVFWFYNFILLCLAFTSLFLLSEDKAHQSWQNRVSQLLKSICVYLGNGKLLYFALFILTLLFYVDS